jgi:hypothetical protein
MNPVDNNLASESPQGPKSTEKEVTRTGSRKEEQGKEEEG